MTWESIEIIFFVISLVVMLFGLAGAVLPQLPGAPVIFAGALLFAIVGDFERVSVVVMVVLFCLMLVSVLLGWGASVLGVKMGGGSKLAVWGAVGGLIVGLFFGLPGIVIGPFLGAVVVELIRGEELRRSFQSGVGALVGFVGGAVGQLAIGLSMVVVFLVAVLG